MYAYACYACNYCYVIIYCVWRGIYGCITTGTGWVYWGYPHTYPYGLKIMLLFILNKDIFKYF